MFKIIKKLWAGRRKVNKNNLKLIVDIEVHNVDTRDYPDFVDAFVGSAYWDDLDVALTYEQLDDLTTLLGDSGELYALALEQLI